jgi:hypothetical protein
VTRYLLNELKTGNLEDFEILRSYGTTEEAKARANGRIDKTKQIADLKEEMRKENE